MHTIAQMKLFYLPACATKGSERDYTTSSGGQMTQETLIRLSQAAASYTCCGGDKSMRSTFFSLLAL